MKPYDIVLYLGNKTGSDWINKELKLSKSQWFDSERIIKYRNLKLKNIYSNKKEYNMLTGAISDSYELPFKALDYLIDAGVSCNACVMISFSNQKDIQTVKDKLHGLWPGLLKSLELENITLFPKVAQRLSNANLIPETVRHRGKIINLNKES